jgi:hypothetical protein
MPEIHDCSLSAPLEGAPRWTVSTCRLETAKPIIGHISPHRQPVYPACAAAMATD